MLKNISYMIASIFLAVLFVTLSSCAGSKLLRTELAQDSEITGSFTLILHGTRHTFDLKTIAFLDKEGDGYVLMPEAPTFDYKVIGNLSAQEALKKAQDFVKWHRSFRRSQVSKIIDDKGSIIGYEIRPLYDPIDYGISNVLVVEYWLKEGGKVKVTIRLHPTAELHLRRHEMPKGQR